jgi:hypothetical protein
VKDIDFEWILFLEIQTYYKNNWVWKEKSVEPSMFSPLGPNSTGYTSYCE